MSAWYKRHFGFDPYTETFDLFERTFMGMAAPKGMLLVSDLEPKITLFMRLPNELLAPLFRDFERCSFAELPKKIGILIAHQAEFDDLQRQLSQ